MTIVGEAFVQVSPLTTGFATKLNAEIAGTGFATNLEKQMGNAGLFAGNSFAARFKRILSTAGLDSGPAFGAALVAGSVVALGLIGEEFSKVRKQIQSETGATGDALSKLATTATNAFKTVPVSLSTAATAVDELFRRGVPLGPQLDRLAQQELFLAKITKTDLGAAVESTTGLMQRFNVPISDQSRELDVLFKAYQASGKSLDVLTSGLQTGGAVLQQFGFNLDQSAALIAGLEKASVNLQPALAGLRLSFGKITKEGGDPKVVLAGLLAEFKSGVDPTKAMADAIQLFGTRSGAELAIAIRKGSFDIDKMLKIITNGRGGIIATGLATLTLGDQFKLLRNNIEASLSGVGTTVLQNIESGLSDIGPPIGHVVAAFADLAVVLAPALADLLVLAAPLKLLAPLLESIAWFVEGVASGLAHVPKPLLAVLEGLALLSIAVKVFELDLVGMMTRLVTTGVVLDTVFAPITLIVAGIALLGAAFNSFGTENRRQAGITKAMSDQLINAAGATSIYAAGIKNATGFVRDFLDVQIAAGKNKDLSFALTLSGSNVEALSAAVTGSTGQWVTYRDAAVRSAQDVARAMGQSGADVRLGGGIVKGTLEEQRKAFIATTSAQIANALALKEITPAQARLIISTRHLTATNGEAGAALDDLNRLIARHVTVHNAAALALTSTKDAESNLVKELAAGTITDAQATDVLKQHGIQGTETAAQLVILKDAAKGLNETIDLSAGKTVPFTAAYGDLATRMALGTITTHDATAALHSMGFSLDGASTAAANLKSQVDGFISSAVSALPTAAKAVQDFASTISSDQSQLASDQAAGVTLQDRLTTSLAASAQKALDANIVRSNRVSAINLKITQDEARIADGSVSTTKTLDADLARRTTILQTAASKGGQASASLAADIVKNNAAIHADYAKIVADNDPSKFTAMLVKQATDIARFTTNIHRLVKEGAGALAGVLVQQGPEAAGALAQGFASDKGKAKIANAAVLLGKHATARFKEVVSGDVSALADIGLSPGQKIGKDIADGIIVELHKLFPQIAPMGVTVGTLFGANVVTSLTGALADGVKFKSGDLVSISGHLGDAVIAGINSHTGGAHEAGIDLMRALGDGVKFKSGDLVSISGTVADGVVAAIRNHTGGSYQVGIDLMVALGDGVKFKSGEVVSLSGLLAANVVAAIASRRTTYQVGIDFMRALGDGMVFKSGDVISISGVLADAVVKNIDSHTTHGYEVGIDLMKWLKIGMIYANGDVVSISGVLADTVVGNIASHTVGKTYQVGIDLMNGIEAGMIFKNGEVVAVGGALADAIVGAIAAHTGSHSPSTLTRAIGVDVGEGLALGIESTGVRTLSASRLVAQGVMQGIRSASGSIWSGFADLAVSSVATFSAGIDQQTPVLTAAFQRLGDTGVNVLQRKFNGIDLSGVGRFQRGEAGSFPVQAPPDAVTIAQIAQSLQITSQAGLNRADALAQARKIEKTPLPVPSITINEKVDPLHLWAEFAWQARGW